MKNVNRIFTALQALYVDLEILANLEIKMHRICGTAKRTSFEDFNLFLIFAYFDQGNIQNSQITN